MDGCDEVSSTNDVLNNNSRGTHLASNVDNGTCDSSSNANNFVRADVFGRSSMSNNPYLPSSSSVHLSYECQLPVCDSNVQFIEIVCRDEYYEPASVLRDLHRDVVQPEMEDEFEMSIPNEDENPNRDASDEHLAQNGDVIQTENEPETVSVPNEDGNPNRDTRDEHLAQNRDVQPEKVNEQAVSVPNEDKNPNCDASGKHPAQNGEVASPDKENEPVAKVSKEDKNPKRDASNKRMAQNGDGKPRKRHRKKSHRSKKHRAGRYQKRKWKPFIKMNAIERRKVEERDARRAQRTRDEMTRYGLSLAPYNTTQFLMEDHKIQTPNYSVSESSDHHKEGGNSTDSSDSYYEYPDDDEYISQNFSEEFQSAFYDLVGEWSHEQLVERYLELENMIDEQNKTLKSTQEQDESKIQVYRVELEKLGEVNRALIEENESLEIRLKLKTEAQ